MHQKLLNNMPLHSENLHVSMVLSQYNELNLPSLQQNVKENKQMPTWPESPLDNLQSIHVHKVILCGY